MNEDKLKIIEEILNETEFNSDQCSHIFNLILKQDCVLGGKLWTQEDIISLIPTKYLNGKNEDKMIAEIASNVDENRLCECSGSEWEALEEAVHDYANENNLDWD